MNGNVFCFKLEKPKENKKNKRPLRNAINELQGKNTTFLGEPRTILCFDNYYMSRESRRLLTLENVKYIAATTKNKCGGLFDIVNPSKNAAGEWSGAFNANSREAIVYCRVIDKDIGQKLVFSNAFR